jgi:hypothetical protein
MFVQSSTGKDSPIEHSKVKFIHLRYHFDDLVSPDNPLGIYNKGGVTIAYQYVNHNEKIIFAMALCCMKDNFNRKIGRAVSSGYLKSGNCYVVDFGDEPDFFHFFNKQIRPKIMNKIGNKYSSELLTALY